MEQKKCVICGFDERVEEHHIIKKIDFGSEEEENLVFLCPNHHWIADFGNEKGRESILRLIKEITGKSGKQINNKDYLEDKIRILVERSLGSYTDKEWEKEHRNKSSNYEFTKKFLLGIDFNPKESSKLNREANILLLVKELRRR